MTKTKRSPRLEKATPRKKKELRLSPHSAPEGMRMEDWQRALRRQFGREQAFEVENVGSQALFSEFRVHNRESGGAYRVRIRGLQLGDNQCDCADFRTNELGTCKHIECVLMQLEGRRGAKAALGRGFRPPYSELFLQPGNPRMLRLRLGSEAPEPVVESAREVFRIESGEDAPQGLLGADRIKAVQRFAGVCAKHGHGLQIDAAARDHVAGLRDAARRRAVLSKAFPRGAASPALAKLVKVPLYPYQAEGALFAVAAGRALIADDMGLGKTIQAIAAAEVFARHFGVRRVLVICPTSLKYQWQREIARFAGRQAQVIDGGRQARRALFEADDFCKITNYEKLRTDLDLIQAWAPELVIVDEAQRVKNWNTIAARAIKRIDSPYAIVLTGTPLENKLEELISIVQFVDQHRLGPTWKLMHEHTERDERGRVTGYIGLDRIGRTLAPILIRRRKAQVLAQLPARTDQQVLVPMTELQATLHEENAQIAARIVQRWRGSGFLSESDQRRLTCALQNMRMVCDSSHLLDPETDHGVKADELAALLDELLADSNEKVVVFSQWLRMHAVLIRRFQARGWGHVLFHGGVPSNQRQALVDRFGNDPQCRIFLATDAGSTGLNLQHAATLVNIDLPWNPAVLEQRVARIHRLGQQRPIRVVNFVARGTIEEGMLSVLAFKRSLAAGILDGGDAEVALEGTRLSRFMKEVESVTRAVQPTVPIAPLEEMAAVAAAPQETDERLAEQDDASQPGRGSTAAADAPSAAVSAPPPDPWAALLGAGTRLVEALAAAGQPAGAAPDHPWIQRDAQTGRTHLTLPLPEADTVGRIADMLVGLAGALAQRR
ncbi:DEAD/DEAH box helicase [Xanthomonas hyacinthi]|nr:helicase SNF2 [Xanthomonas hyacinthi DSM 19077]